jgi:hypothetical protein
MEDHRERFAGTSVRRCTSTCGETPAGHPGRRARGRIPAPIHGGMHLKRTILAVTTLALLLGAASAFAVDMKGGLGFHTDSAPIGIRHWLNEKVAIDAAVGFNSSTITTGSPSVDNKTSGWTVDVGLPISMKKWEKVNFLLRPGFMYSSNKLTPPSPASDVTLTDMRVSGEFECEVWIADNVSLSASHGIAFDSGKDDRTPENKTSGFMTTGAGFTQVGFHVYLW